MRKKHILSGPLSIWVVDGCVTHVKVRLSQVADARAVVKRFVDLGVIPPIANLVGQAYRDIKTYRPRDCVAIIFDRADWWAYGRHRSTLLRRAADAYVGKSILREMKLV